MNSTLISNWNSTIGPDDDIYHLGDFAYKGDSTWLLNKLNGKKHLIEGNHDKKNLKNISWRSQWTSIQPYLELVVDKKLIVMCHYPFQEWNGYYRDAWHIHGHSHGRTPAFKNRIDVGVDSQNFTPVSVLQLRKQIEKTPR